MTGNRYNPDALQSDNPNLEIHASNADDEDHEMLVFRLAEGVTTAQLIWYTGPGLPDGVTFVGQATIPAHTSGTMVLVGLDPGSYAIVDLLPSDNGVPHLSLGMEATLTVTTD